MKTLFRTRNRAGFTLVELLVVMALMVLLATLTVAVLPSTDSRSCSRAADQVQGWLFAAKNRAIRDQTTRGIRLVRSSNLQSAGLITELQYLEQPDIYVPRGTNGTLATVLIGASTPAVANSYTATIIGLSNSDLSSLGSSNPLFGPNDILEANTGTGYRFSIKSAALVKGNAVVSLNAINPATNSFDPNILGLNGTVRLGAGECRIIRQPKPVIGEQPLLLPKGVCIDPALSSPTTLNSTLASQGYYDILFGAGGEVLGQNSPRTILWVRSVEDRLWAFNASSNPNVYVKTPTPSRGFGSPTLISIFARSGAVSSHPVDNNKKDASGNPNPLNFANDGHGDSGM